MVSIASIETVQVTFQTYRKWAVLPIIFFYEGSTENTVIKSVVILGMSCLVVHKYQIFQDFQRLGSWFRFLFFFTIQDGDLINLVFVVDTMVYFD